VLEALAERPELVGLPAIEGHTLRVLAEADQAESEVRLVALPVEVQADEGSAEQVGEPRAADRVEHGDPYHVSGQGNRGSADGHREGAGETPQDSHEGHRGRKGG